MDRVDLPLVLPWSHPFRMVDRMIECVPHRSVVTLKRVTAGDSIFDGADSSTSHFPSVLVIEGLGQTAALLFRLSYGPGSLDRMPLLGHLNATIHGAAEPGATIEYTVTAVKMTTRGGIFRGIARADGATIVESELGFGLGST